LRERAGERVTATPKTKAVINRFLLAEDEWQA
jgi:hypothetical protein